MKKMFFALVLIGAVISIAVAQDSRMPQASLDREVTLPVPAGEAVLGNPTHQTQAPPKYCRPCLFYAGDFDSNATDANGLANEFDVIVSTGAAVYTPFIVPKGKTWTVTGLFTNDFLSGWMLDPATSPYEIRKGIPAAGGSGGKLVCHGRLKSTAIQTGIIRGYPFLIWAVSVRGIKGCTLKSGKYWMSVIPYCTDPNDGTCENGYRSMLSNDDGALNHRFGPLEPANDSFFNSTYFGANWDPSSKWQNSVRFSVGVEGTSK
jgi:hypothetical protein